MDNLVVELVVAAALGSVNPCTFYIYAALLLAASIRGHCRRAAAATGLCFILGVYTGYLAVGLGIASLAPALTPRMLAVTLLAMAALLLAPKPRLPTARVVLAAGPAAALLLGLIVSLTLLPCSSGPLLAFIALAAARGMEPLQLLPYLLLYNAVFVAPLVVLTVAAAQAAPRLAALLAGKRRVLDSATAALLVAVAAALMAGYS